MNSGTWLFDLLMFLFIIKSRLCLEGNCFEEAFDAHHLQVVALTTNSSKSCSSDKCGCG